MVNKSILPMLFILLILLAGCAGNQTAAGGSDNESGIVQITLSEFKIESSQTEFKAGVPYRLVITNQGQIAHELMVMPPVMAGMGTHMDDMHAIALVMVEDDLLPPGATQTLEITFDQAYQAGQLEFACHTPGHYEAGMLLPVIVK